MAKRKASQLGFVMLAAGQLASAAAPRQGENGQPIQRFTKDLIRVGPWKHPNSGENLDVTAERLAHWVEQFAAMKKAGVKVYVPSGHTDDAQYNRGWVEEMWVDGETLMAAIDIIGEDAIKEAARNEVSIYVPPRVQDGKGNEYQDAIAHVALTPTPVISGQKPFVAIAASRGGTVSVPVLRLAYGDQNMETWKKVAAILGVTLPEDADEAAAMAACEAKIKELAGGAASVTKTAEELKTATTALAAARKELAEKSEYKPTPVELKLSRENRTMKLQALVTDGKILPAVAEKLKAAFAGDDATLSLSLSGNGDRLWEGVLAALADNDPVKLGEVSKGQTLKLARVTPGGDAKDDGWVDDVLKARNTKTG